MLIDSLANGIGLNSQVGALEQFAKLFNEGLEARFFLQVGGVDPVPGKVFKKDGGDVEFLPQNQTERGDVAEDEFGLGFKESSPDLFEDFVVKGQEAFEPGDGLVKVVLEGRFLDQPDVGFELVCLVRHLGRKIFPPKPVGQSAEYLDGQSGSAIGKGP